MFTYAYAITSIILAATSKKEWRIVAFIVSAEFITHKLSFLYIWKPYLFDKNQSIFVIYAIINLVALGFCKLAKCHYSIGLLLFLNMVYNFLTAFGWYEVKFNSFYHWHDLIVGIIMTLELVYIGMLNRYVSNDVFTAFRSFDRSLCDLLSGRSKLLVRNSA